MADADRLLLTVAELRTETPLIRSITLVRPNGEPLPSWQAGAHIDVQVPGVGERSYSLINFSRDPHATTRPTHYRIGVRLEDPSTGGSRFMHALKVDDQLSVSAPSNNFALEPNTRPFVLLAGGIGITPLTSIAASLTAEAHPFRLYYAGRSREHLALVPELESLCDEKLMLHTDDVTGSVFDVRRLMQSLSAGEQVYCCGPRPMIDSAIALAKEFGWDQRRLRFELFTVAAPRAGDTSFEVVLKSTGESFLIPSGKSILDVLIDAGKDPIHDCKRGDFGICQVGVVEGVPDHRDYILTDAEKAEGKKMQICVSRSKRARLVIDL